MQRYQTGQILTAQIVEINRDGSYVCSVHGRLLRIENKTTDRHSPGTQVQLQVIQSDPLVFALFEKRKNFERRI